MVAHASTPARHHAVPTRGHRGLWATYPRHDRGPRRRGGAAEAVLDLIEVGADVIVPLANGEPVSVLDAIEGRTPTDSAVSACTRCMRCTTGSTCTARCETGCCTSLTSFLRSRAGHFMSGDASWSRTISARFPAPPGDDEMSMVRGGRPDGPAWILLVGNELRLRRRIHRERAVLPRGQHLHAPHVRTESNSRQPGRRLDRSGSAADRSRTEPARRAERAIAAHVAERIPERGDTAASIGAITDALLERPATTVTSGSTPS